MSFSRSLIVGVVTHGVRERDPPQEMAHPSVLAGLHYQVPMIGHQLVGQDSAGIELQSLGQDVFESLVVGVFVKDGRTPIAPI